jgi:hypothetical protein
LPPFRFQERSHYQPASPGERSSRKTTRSRATRRATRPSTLPPLLKHADLDHDDGDADQIAAPEIEAADLADTGHEARI